MLFSGVPFLYFFLPSTLILYFLAPKKYKNAVLFLASTVFYAWGEQMLAVLFVATAALGWVFALLIENAQSRAARRALMLTSVSIDLALLGYFKYADFFLSTLNSAFSLSLPLLRVALPIGISFYTFQLISYTVDVYRGDVPAQKSFINFAAYLSMFPQLIAGPIVRYADVAPQLENRTHTLASTAEGVRRFLTGLGKKVLLANVLGEIAVSFRQSPAPSVLFYWLYALSFALQIYFDFSGYSDMAIGLGRIFGFRFMENFDYPFISASVTEFWRRWHISLGSWFRDYVYIPLGGNRRGLARQILNVAVVWTLTGLWHGADWNFVLWGAYYAFLLTVEKLWLKKRLDRHPVFGRVYLIFATLFGFVIFNAQGLSGAASDMAGLFAFRSLPLASPDAVYCLRSYALTLALAVIAATPLPKILYEKLSGSRLSPALTVLEPLALTAVLLLSTAYLVDGSFNPFLYFRF